jgi:hypothetical protein
MEFPSSSLLRTVNAVRVYLPKRYTDVFSDANRAVSRVIRGNYSQTLRSIQVTQKVTALCERERERERA